MSAEVTIGSITHLVAKSHLTNGHHGEDTVTRLASDRPSPSQDSLPALPDPASDRQDASLQERRATVDEKHRRVIGVLDSSGLDALLLSRADSIAWFTTGAEVGQWLTSEAGSVLLFVNHNSRAVLCDNVQTARVFEEELSGLGFQLKERPWTEDPARLIGEIAGRKRVASDGWPNFPNAQSRLRPLRASLYRLERQRLRELGRTLTLAVEATCRNFHSGETEADIAGHLAHRLLREGVIPVDLRVAGDGRLFRYRQPLFKAAAINRWATITAIGRRHGLCAAVSRTVSFGPPPAEVRAAHALAAMVDATCIFFSRPGEAIGDIFRRARRIYEKFDHPDEWLLNYQGVQLGYSPRENLLLPDSGDRIVSNCALAWSPSVETARSEDTVVVDERGYEVVTDAQNWPKLEVAVKGFTIPRPGILER